MIKKILFLMLIFFQAGAWGQNLQWGGSFGLAFSFGTEVNRLGIHTAVYANYGFAQINAAVKGYYNFKSLGKETNGFELQAGAGAQFGFGRKDTVRNNFIGLAENNTFHDYALGFAFVRYQDMQGTSQSTGMVNANVLNFSIVSENDLFGNFVRQYDRYRTGTVLVDYQYQNTKIGITTLLWTYDYGHCNVIDNEETKKWARFGYYHDPYVSERARSVGIVALQVRQWLPYNQMPNVAIGLNSEKVRNVFQNEFIHDQPFFPSSWVKRKPAHIPMLTIDNEQYLHQNSQLLKPGKFFFNIGLNTLPFY